MPSVKNYIFIAVILAFCFPRYTAAQDYALAPTEVSPLLISEQIPDVTVKSIEGKEVKLRNVVSAKPTILIFYRGGWCPYCNRHLSELQSIIGELKSLGYQLIALSADRPGKLKESMGKHDLEYTLISDHAMTASKAFGLAFKVDDATYSRYKELGLDLEADSGYDHHLLPVPAVYMVNTDGIVQFNYVNPDYKERINGNILLTAAKVYAGE